MNQVMTQGQEEKVVQLLKENGCRITKQRKIILDVILNDKIVSCKEVFYKASKQDSGIGEATVYRMIRLLEELDIIRRQDAYALVMEA